MTRTLTMIVAIAATTASAFTVTTAAEAKKYGSGYKSYSYNAPYAAHGYEGFISNGPVSKYCSYTRYPIRKCKYTKHGRKCWVDGWRIDQKCY